MTTEIPITNSYTGTPFTIEVLGGRRNTRSTAIPVRGSIYAMEGEANKLSMLNSNLEKIFKLEKGYFGKEDKYELLQPKK